MSERAWVSGETEEDLPILKSDGERLIEIGRVSSRGTPLTEAQLRWIERTAGMWAEVDTEKLKADIRESRNVPRTNPSVP